MSKLNSSVPRLPLSSTPSSSRRTSVDTSRSSPARTPTQAQPQASRRNRAALRDYYNLKSAAPADVTGGWQAEEVVRESELDKEGFVAEKYVTELLGKEDLEGILRVEGDLVNQIKFLDGERKALVYDNYSKLITATETIKRMRANMDPLAPTTSTLAPAIAHIAVTAEGLAQKLQPKGTETERKEASAREEKLKQERDTVKWALQAPGRLKSMDKKEAELEWKTLQILLDKWRGVDGVETLRGNCRQVLDSFESAEDDDDDEEEEEEESEGT